MPAVPAHPAGVRRSRSAGRYVAGTSSVYWGAQHMPMDVALLDLAVCVTQAADLVNPAMVDHHKRVAYLADRIARGMELPLEAREDLVMAAAMHDVGALALKDLLGALDFEYDDVYTHTEPGYLMLRRFAPFSRISHIVRAHHVQWHDGQGTEYMGEEVPLESHIIHLADRIAVLVRRATPVLEQRDGICERVRAGAREMFVPEGVDAFLDLSAHESFWLDLIGLPADAGFMKVFDLPERRVSGDALEEFTHVISQMIDFRSAFTATHSSGVSASAAALGAIHGMSAEELSMMRCAGNLHDVGKLAVSNEILEKNGPLDDHEWAIMKTHNYYTHKVISSVGGLDMIGHWASYHHERLDGDGYPFHLGASELDLGARIMAVADIFTAITEDRPYREGMSRERAMDVLRTQAEAGAIDVSVVGALVDSFDRVNGARVAAQEARKSEYLEFQRDLEVGAALLAS